MAPELILALALTAADASQTTYIAQHPQEHCEHNPILGKHPTVAQVGGYFALSAGGLVLANEFLTKEQAKTLNHVWIGMEGANVVRNFGLGIRFSF